ncbi:MAG: galactose mutarotase [Sporolactobacillus sp.]|jgi:aldose 1-epimerase|nr:galactose mutarotase [Sporolactobacillus sp.]
MEVTKGEFGMFHNQTVWQYTLTNDNDVKLKVMNYGATLNAIEVPDRNGQINDVVLGYDHFDDYLKQSDCFGATIGRVAGRIAKGQFTIDQNDYQLPVNDRGNTLHGGPNSFDKQLWTGHPFQSDDRAGVKFDLYSADGTNGFPGNLHVSVSYSLNNRNEWQLHCEATTDKPTLFNPTNHVYFNLTGDLTQTIGNHLLTVNSQKYGEIKKDGLPTGRLIDVEGTLFDFRRPAPVKRGFESDDPQNKLVNGYDHPFLLDKESGKPDAILEDPGSGRRVTMTTTNNSVVVYTGNGLSPSIHMAGKPMQPHQGITLEAQIMPDAIHHEGFGNIILRPGETFTADTVYRFDRTDK